MIEETTTSDSMPEICMLKHDILSTCSESNSTWYFDIESGICKKIYKGWCLMNENQFETMEKCEQSCSQLSGETRLWFDLEKLTNTNQKEPSSPGEAESNGKC